MRRRVPQQGRFGAVSHDQTHIGRKQILGERVIDGEEQHVAEGAVILPLAVGQEVARPRFHLDAGETAVGPEGEDVGPPSVRERYFVSAAQAS